VRTTAISRIEYFRATTVAKLPVTNSTCARIGPLHSLELIALSTVLNRPCRWNSGAVIVSTDTIAVTSPAGNR